MATTLERLLPHSALLAAALWSHVAVAQPADVQSQSGPLQVIELVQADNPPLDLRPGLLVLAEAIDDERHRGLRAFAKALPAAPVDDELSAQLAIAAWVHAHIEHDSFNAAPAQATALDVLKRAANGERFSCVEYSRVLKETLAAFGHVARTLSLQSTAVAYGPLGSGHVASELWSNALNKWVFVDAQWGVYARHGGSPLSYYELFELKRAGRLSAVRFVPLGGAPQPDDRSAAEREAQYRAFIGDYFGYLSARYTQAEQTVNLVLPLDGSTLPLTFQGLGRSGQLFTTDPRDHYFTLNHTNMLLYYQDQPTAKRPHGEIDIASADEYLARMPQFAATPDYLVVLHHNMPWFDHFEVALGEGPWQRLDDNQFTWTAQSGTQTLKARAINSAGVAGPVSFLTLRYGLPR